MRLLTTTALAAGLALLGGAALAADVKIGMITTLSGPAGYLGADIRDGFNLAMKDGTLGGVPVEVEVQDDKLDPAQGRQIADRMLNDEGIKLMTGIVFSNVAGAVVPEVTGADAIYVSPNAAPSTLAGKGCNKNYFVASWQNDTLHEMPGLLATKAGYKTAYLVAPNYQAGKDGLTGFKREFKGEVLGEEYTPMGQTDFSAVMAKIRDAKPEVVYQFHPGEAGIAFIKQYQAAGLGTIPMVLAEPAADGVIIKALGDQAIGTKLAVHWAEGMDNPANKAMMDAWRAAYPGRPMTTYAEQSYQTALLIGEALKATGGKVDDIDALREGLRGAKIDSPAGAFAWGPNQHPVEDWYAAEIVKGDDGAPTIKVGEKIAEARQDIYAAECKM